MWRFPLKGTAEHVSHSTDFEFKTKTREAFKDTVKVQLPGLLELRPNDTFSHELVPLNPNLAGLLDRSVVIEEINTKLLNVEDELEFFLIFEPWRPFKASTELLISKSSGGRWKFNVTFEASEPEIDDVISITSPLNKTSSVSFKLTNHRGAYADFNAFFTHDSATEFTVFPKTGTLEPYGKEGTNFIVSFTPTEYGKPKIGKLVIQTEEVQWLFLQI
jgi:hypothetical protein